MCEVCFQFTGSWICSSYWKTCHAAHLFINERANELLCNAATPGHNSHVCHHRPWLWHSEGTTLMDKEPPRVAGVFCYTSSCLAMVHGKERCYSSDLHSSLNSNWDFCLLWPLLYSSGLKVASSTRTSTEASVAEGKGNVDTAVYLCLDTPRFSELYSPI